MICQVISSFFPIVGGSEQVTKTLSQGLNAQGHPTVVLTSWYPGLLREERIGNTPVYRLGNGSRGKLRSLTFGLASVGWIWRHRHEVKVVHAQSIDTPLLVGLIVKWLLRKPLVLTVNYNLAVSEKQETLLGRLRLGVLHQSVDRFAAISKTNERMFLDAGLSPNRVSVIPNSIDTDFFHPPTTEARNELRAQHGISPDALVIIHSGRLIPSKRVDLLIQAVAALKQHPNVCVLIVGDGPERTRLEALSEKLNISNRVKFTGAQSEIRDFYWMSDIFAFPTETEGLSLALLENLACGLTVVASDCQGNLDVLQHNVNALIFETGNLEALIEALGSVITNPNQREMLKTSGRVLIERKYSLDVYLESMLKLYEEAACPEQN
ncbi:MAG: glycosyltransferase family 4 protein [Anaerolineae bacterium]|nr:glycosyltransferase family 4 protein [Anaerolineae bacterium]